MYSSILYTDNYTVLYISTSSPHEHLAPQLTFVTSAATFHQFMHCRLQRTVIVHSTLELKTGFLCQMSNHVLVVRVLLLRQIACNPYSSLGSYIHALSAAVGHPVSLECSPLSCCFDNKKLFSRFINKLQTASLVIKNN